MRIFIILTLLCTFAALTGCKAAVSDKEGEHGAAVGVG